MYGCKNRAPFAPSIQVADGWENSWARRMVDMEFRMSLACQYRETDLGKADPKCSGCKWRTDDAERTPETPALADGTSLDGGIQGDEWIKDWLSCDPSTGVMTWKKTTGKARAGGTAGALGARGYLYVRLKGRTMLSHRLVWWFENGEWPALPIDHINGDPIDNRIGNLRLASALVNAQNLRSAHRDSKTGVLGVAVSRGGKYVAQIMSRGKKYVLGTFSTTEEAHAAYVQAKRRLHEGCTL